jgi:DNA-binding NarL/FixJ family response regulator
VTRDGDAGARPTLEGARRFSFVHDGQQLLVHSEPLRPPPVGLLTPAELAVARAISQGDSNAEIARARGTSIRTVANQVASILVRLGAGSRAQVAARLTRVSFELVDTPLSSSRPGVEGSKL